LSSVLITAYRKGVIVMAKGFALTIGLNAVDPGHYSGWSGVLNACEADAQDMAAIAKSRKFKFKTLLTHDATRANLVLEMTKAAKILKRGDIFLLSYSGHGGQVSDLTGDEPDDMDETWCLFDGELIDDELYLHLGKFGAGVRVLVFSDSCHSGTVTRMAYYRGTTMSRALDTGGQEVTYRYMPPDVALRTYRDNKQFYVNLQRAVRAKDARQKVRASVLLISGCQDNQYSADGVFNGLFTSQLLKVWNHGRFRRSYRDFHAAIVRRMPPDQTPNYFWAGPYDKRFEAQRPFTV
jgi:metacaspase-1